MSPVFLLLYYFNPQGPRGPRRLPVLPAYQMIGFQSTRPSRASTGSGMAAVCPGGLFQSTRPSRASTYGFFTVHASAAISIHKALAGLDSICIKDCWHNRYFNPQGPRGPRPGGEQPGRGLRSISIHKALAGLDSKTIQQSLHIPLTFYALCPPLLISTSSIHSPSLFSRLFLCFSGANLPDISC